MLSRAMSLTLLLVGVFLFTACPLPKIPQPDPAGPATIPPAEDSTFQVPITANLEPLRAQLDALVPRVIVEDNGQDCTEYGVYKRRAVQLSAAGNVVTANVGIEYRFKGYVINQKPLCLGTVQCGYGEPSPKADVLASSALTWNPNWHLNSQTGVTMNMLDPCNLSALNIDVSQRIRQLMQPKLNDIAATIDQRIPQATNIRSAADMGWKKLQSPISLGPNLWLMVNPVTPQVSTLNGSGTNMTLSVGLVGKPAIFVQAAPPTPAVGNLPPLSLTPAGDRFHIALDGHLSYSSATNLARTALVGQEFKYGRYKVKIKDASVFGSDKRLVLQLKISGSVSGTVYFIGTPQFVSDAQGERIIVPDLDYTLDTRNVIARVADWLLHCNFLDPIRRKAVFPLDDSIANLRTRLEAGLNQPLGTNATISGRVDALRIAGVYIDSTQIVVRAIADGKAAVTVN